MECEGGRKDMLLETITKELVSIIEEGSENSESDLKGQNVEEITSCKPSSTNTSGQEENSETELLAKCAVLEAKNISGIDGDIQKMICNLDESCKMFQAIGRRFENINLSCLKNRIRDLHLSESRVDPIKTIVKDLKHSFDEKYMENRLNELTKDIASKFRNHPGEFGDIPEISEFFRTCTKLEQGLEKLRRQRDDCLNLQNRMTKVAEASYDRVKNIQQKFIRKDCKKQNEENVK